MGQAGAVPPPYDVFNFLNLLGIELSPLDEDHYPIARLTVTHDLIAGTGFLWAPVVITLADALCAFGVNHHWPEGATIVHDGGLLDQLHFERAEGDLVVATASPLHTGRTTQVWDAKVTNETSERLMASYRCTQLILY